MKAFFLAAALLASTPMLALAQIAPELQQAAEQGDVAAQLRLGLIYYKGASVAKNDAEAAKWLRKAADQGDNIARVILGTLYVSGAGVDKDVAQGLNWIRLAAEAGDARAQAVLGNFYDGAVLSARADIPVDKAEAVKWYRLAAAQGMADVQANLGAMYARGDGVTRDYIEAYKWSLLAAEQEDGVAIRNVPLLEKLMTPAQVADAVSRVDQTRSKYPPAHR